MRAMGADILDGYLLGAAVKYIMRQGRRDGEWLKDIEKAVHCLEVLIEENTGKKMI
jgi:hypothetical protein